MTWWSSGRCIRCCLVEVMCSNQVQSWNQCSFLDSVAHWFQNLEFLYEAIHKKYIMKCQIVITIYMWVRMFVVYTSGYNSLLLIKGGWNNHVDLLSPQPEVCYSPFCWCCTEKPQGCLSHSLCIVECLISQRTLTAINRRHTSYDHVFSV